MADTLTTIAEEIRKALMPGHTDSTRLIRLHTGNVVHSLLAETLTGVEEIGPSSNSQECTAGFAFDLKVLCATASLDAPDWLGKPILIELLTQQSRFALRPFHGHITAFERLQADGAFGYFRLRIEPWLAFLGHRRDSFVFHDMSVPEIIEAVFADYSAQGALVPAWRLDLADASAYPKRSICTQYNETDLAFIERLMAEEGLYYWFEHTASGTLDGASHKMVIADHTGAFTENAQARIRFHRANATESQDTIQSIVPQRSLATHSIEIASWDYRSLDTRSASASSTPDEAVADMPLTRFDAPGAYIWPTREQGERYAARQIEALEAARLALTGSGTVRTLSPGTTFTLDNHFDADMPADTDPADRNRYALLRVAHHARNNLNPSLSKGLAALQGDSSLLSPDSSLYSNSFTLLPAPVPFRPIAQDARGITLRARPTVRGAQSAIVVGDANQPVHTDRDGRIRVQFHWQRGNQSHSRLTHPSGAEDASGDKAAWSWVRVMTAWAGANWGGHFIPRVGQEVLVEFIEGDIDRPVVVGALYNGQGAANAQNNQVASGAGVATGNAPAWFAGDTSPLPAGEGQGVRAAGERHAHPDTLAGIKTQALSASQSGSGGYNQLVFDLTPNEPRTQLATTQFASTLNLGAIRHQTDNQRLAYRAHGAELATLQSGALRAGSGLLLSTDARNNASGTQMDARLASNQLDAAHSLVKTLAESAQKQKADLQGDPAPDKLAAAEQLAHSSEVLTQTDTQGGSSPLTPDSSPAGAGTAPAWSEPMIVAESPAGIGTLTPKDAILNAGDTLTLAAQDIHLAAQGKSAWAVKDGIALYTYGKQSDAKRPVSDKGLMLHAAKGKLSVQAQSDKADFNADKKVTITSTTKDVLLQGKNDLQLTAGGASIQISGGNITLTAPGKVSLLASQRNLTSAKSVSPAPVSFTQSNLNLSSGAHYLRYQATTSTGEPIKGASYVMFGPDGSVLATGKTDAQGRTQQITTDFAQRVHVYLQDDEHQGYHVQPQEN
ncbi:type VI secretion system Vgr family protein [Viridibacterium curvum]|uniref:Type VI secretion system Vgr family protein n=1 Tax=Viridibacterium curvum TaxID=1101404 RepID=A0ABP9R9I2_9RHOO